MVKLKGRVVQAIEKRTGQQLEDILWEYERYRTPVPHIAKLLEVKEVTIHKWRRKLGMSRKQK